MTDKKSLHYKTLVDQYEQEEQGGGGLFICHIFHDFTPIIVKIITAEAPRSLSLRHNYAKLQSRRVLSY